MEGAALADLDEEDAADGVVMPLERTIGAMGPVDAVAAMTMHLPRAGWTRRRGGPRTKRVFNVAVGVSGDQLHFAGVETGRVYTSIASGHGGARVTALAADADATRNLVVTGAADGSLCIRSVVLQVDMVEADVFGSGDDDTSDPGGEAAAAAAPAAAEAAAEQMPAPGRYHSLHDPALIRRDDEGVRRRPEVHFVSTTVATVPPYYPDYDDFVNPEDRDPEAPHERPKLVEANPAVPRGARTAAVTAVTVYRRRKYVLVVAAYDSGVIRVFSRDGLLRYNAYSGNGTVNALAWSDGGNQMAFASDEGIGMLRMTRTRRMLEHYCSYRPQVQSAVVSLQFDAHNPVFLYAGTADGHLILFSARRPKGRACASAFDLRLLDADAAPIAARRNDSLPLFGAGGGGDAGGDDGDGGAGDPGAETAAPEWPVRVATMPGYVMAASPTHLFLYNVTLAAHLRATTRAAVAPAFVAAVPLPGAEVRLAAAASRQPLLVATLSDSYGDMFALLAPAGALGAPSVFRAFLPFDEGKSNLGAYRAPMFLVALLLIAVYQICKGRTGGASSSPPLGELGSNPFAAAMRGAGAGTGAHQPAFGVGSGFGAHRMGLAGFRRR